MNAKIMHPTRAGAVLENASSNAARKFWSTIFAENFILFCRQFLSSRSKLCADLPPLYEQNRTALKSIYSMQEVFYS